MNSTDAPTPHAERLTAATLATLAVASMLAAGAAADDTVPASKPQKPPTYIAGGVWGGT